MAVKVLFTIGRSTHSIEEFIELLYAHHVQHLVDVRSIPKSRHVPQFNTDALASSLRANSIYYSHLKALDGRRHSRKDSINTGWRNTAFRVYADYMVTPQFAAGLAAPSRSPVQFQPRSCAPKPCLGAATDPSSPTP